MFEILSLRCFPLYRYAARPINEPYHTAKKPGISRFIDIYRHSPKNTLSRTSNALLFFVITFLDNLSNNHIKCNKSIEQKKQQFFILHVSEICM